MIERRTPIARSTVPLERTALPPRRTPIAATTRFLPRRRTPIPKIGRKARREAEALAAFRFAVRSRAWCEGNTPACPYGPHPGAHAHHRWPEDRDAGRHDPARGLYLCAPGHAWVHANPREAGIRGLLR